MYFPSPIDSFAFSIRAFKAAFGGCAGMTRSQMRRKRV
jgi:hypothetical protein